MILHIYLFIIFKYTYIILIVIVVIWVVISSGDCNDESNDDDYLEADEATVFRACAARCNFLGLDRPDVQYAAKEISRHMAKPRQRDVVALKRLGRYLKQYPRAIFKYKFQKMPNTVRIFCDSNYAGCTETRKSTQGGVAMLGQHCVKSWSSTQATIALSSAEAEFYGIVKACSVSLGMRSLLADMKVSVSLDVLTDASAAKGIASKKGLPNKARHINVHFLWIQEKHITKDINLQKIWGHDNPADILTKFLDTETMTRHTRAFGLEYREGRSAEAPQIAMCSHVWRFSGMRAQRSRPENHKPPKMHKQSVSYVRDMSSALVRGFGQGGVKRHNVLQGVIFHSMC